MSSEPSTTFEYAMLKKCSDPSSLLPFLAEMDKASTLYHVRENLVKFADDMLASMSQTKSKQIGNQVQQFVNATLVMMDCAAREDHIANIKNNDLDKIAEKIIKKINIQQPNSKPSPKVVKPQKFIVKAKDPSINPDQIFKEISDMVKQDDSLQIDDMKKGLTAVKVSSINPNTKAKISQHLATKEIGEKVEFKDVNLLLPQISAVIQQHSIESIENIKRRNNIPDNEEVKIVASYDIPQRNQPNKKKIIIRLSRNARQIIENKGRMYIGSESVRIVDNFYIKTCTNCLAIGHTAKYCSANQCCYKCEQSHDPATCEAEKQTCCLYFKKNNLNNLNHKPKTRDCAAFQQAINNLKNITDWNYADQSN